MFTNSCTRFTDPVIRVHRQDVQGPQRDGHPCVNGDGDGDGDGSSTDSESGRSGNGDGDGDGEGDSSSEDDPPKR